MLNLISLGLGAIAFLLTLVAFLPLLGWGNWFILPLAITGFVVGLISRHHAGQRFNLLVIAIGVGRLLLGGGIF